MLFVNLRVTNIFFVQLNYLSDYLGHVGCCEKGDLCALGRIRVVIQRILRDQFQNTNVSEETFMFKRDGPFRPSFK